MPVTIVDQAGLTIKLFFVKTYTGKFFTYVKLIGVQHDTVAKSLFMKNILTRISAPFVGLGGTILFFLFVFSQEVGFCTSSQMSCVQMFDSFAEVFQIFLPLLLLAAITYKMRDEISLAWLGFARWWIPLSMFLILIAPSDKGDWMFPHDKGRVSFFASLLFFFVSLVIVASKYFSLKGGKRR